MRVSIRSYPKNALPHNMSIKRNTNPCGYRMGLVTRAYSVGNQRKYRHVAECQATP